MEVAARVRLPLSGPRYPGMQGGRDEACVLPRYPVALLGDVPASLPGQHRRVDQVHVDPCSLAPATRPAPPLAAYDSRGGRFSSLVADGYAGHLPLGQEPQQLCPPWTRPVRRAPAPRGPPAQRRGALTVLRAGSPFSTASTCSAASMATSRSAPPAWTRPNAA